MDELELRVNPRIISATRWNPVARELKRLGSRSIDPSFVIKLHNLTRNELKALRTCCRQVRSDRSGAALVHGTIFPKNGLGTLMTRTIEAYSQRTRRLRYRDGHLDLGSRTLIMGILNVTPDSFFDGGRWSDARVAVRRGVEMIRQGTDIVDVGGESTRPGSDPVAEDEELRRVVPVVEGLAARKAFISIDTYKPRVAEAAVRAGARMINDITGLANPDMSKIALRLGVPVVIMHIQGSPKTMQENPRYADLISEITATLRRRIQASGLERDRIVIDPGIGFGKRPEHNVEILSRLSEFRSLGFPLLIGTSRKRFVGDLLGGKGAPERLHGTLATVAAAVAEGVDIVRVHDIAETLDVVRVMDAVRAF